MKRRFYQYAPAFGKNKLMDDITSSMVIFFLHILEITDKLTIIEEQITLVKRFYNEHVRMGAHWNVGAKNRVFRYLNSLFTVRYKTHAHC